ncbi:DNA repair protein RAD50 [Linum perenne]
MSTVDKMLIKGIRSFDPENKHVITFFKPLTLIVGSNGAGKTVFLRPLSSTSFFQTSTIIECLKVACTGELPPNARNGHSFVHDPKVAGETETKGQIKLRFKTAAGKDVVCIRSFQLTQKASKLEYKAIESVLQTINPHTGEKVCLSYRCADMDREIPALMGVSKAVLENVIFVHQDEANWPLQDPSSLKKKFDDIFSATRYTKALEVIKKLHKDQAQEIKAYKLKLENLQTLKDSAYKLRESISQDQEKTESLKIQIQDLQSIKQNVDGRIQETKSKLEELRKLHEQISTKGAARRVLVDQMEQQLSALDSEITDDDEELISWKKTFDSRVATFNTKISKLSREIEDADKKASNLRKTIKESIEEIGRLGSEADAHTSVKNERDSTIRELCAKYNAGSLHDTPLTDEMALNLTDCLETRSMNLKKDLQEKKKLIDVQVKAAEKSCRDASDAWKVARAQLQAKEELKKNISDRIKEKENELAPLEEKLSHSNLPRIDEKERNTGIEVGRKTKQLSERDFESNIRQKQSDLYGIEQNIKALNREKDVLAVDSEDRIMLSLKRTELDNHKKKHRKIIDEYKDKIRGVLKGRLPSDKDLKKEVTQALSRALGNEFDDLNAKSRDAEKEVNVLHMKIQDTNNNISRFHKDMDAKKRFIESKLQSLDQQSFTIESYFKALESAKEKRDVQKSKYNIADGMRQMFDPFERVARAHHICPCCERSFSPEEEDDFVKKQRVKAASSTEHIKKLAMETSNSDSLFQQLDKLRIAYEEYVKLGKDAIPLAEKSLHDLQQELDQKSQALDDVLGILAQIKSDKDSVDVLVQPMDTADRLYQEIQTLQKQVHDLEYKLDLQGQGARSMEEIQSELNCLQSTRDSLQSELEKLREEQRYMENDLQHIQLRWHALREEKVTALNILSNVKRLEEELENLAVEKNEAELATKDLAENLGPLSKAKEKLESDYEKLKSELDLEYEDQRKEFENYRVELDTVHKLMSKIKEYYDLKRGERLKEAQEKLATSESQLECCETMKGQHSNELAVLRGKVDQQDKCRRDIEDNINYRKTKADVELHTNEIESLENTVLQIGTLSKFEADLEKLLGERDRLLQEVSGCRGTMKVYETNVYNNKVDLERPLYKDIDKRYFDQLLELKTTEMANKDLDRYYSALDKALMRFHTMKMEEINKIIRELWQQTYRGQDIDYIRIHSDTEGSGTRSYSYKVLMQTGDTELEMRGRCSAGQKVLASLIIRLALAETFCLHCGILALDEPTTNLDGPNAESLAAALLRIMKDRKGQENFQLIVITHDERFAQMIGQRQHAERYYRVSKDDHQHSIIEAQEIFD